MPNIYFFLYARGHIDTAMRHLLDLCFLEVAKQNIHKMQKSEQIAAKIQQRAQGRASYPQQNPWPMQRDRETFEQATIDYKELYINQYLTCLVFQAASQNDY